MLWILARIPMPFIGRRREGKQSDRWSLVVEMHLQKLMVLNRGKWEADDEVEGSNEERKRPGQLLSSGAKEAAGGR
jgi:hypothetical protein